MKEAIKNRVQEVLIRLGLPEKRLLIEKIEAECAEADFWKDHRRAKEKMQQLALVKKEVEEGEQLEKSLRLKDENLVKKLLTKFEYILYFSNTYDKEDAILSIHAGQGGTEAMDWAAMIYRMYRRYCERKGWSVEEIDIIYGEEAGIKSVTMHVSGRFAYGFLKAEAGVHRLVRQSPFNADKLRQTSFAMVEVMPDIEESDESISIREEDLKWDFFRSGGKGGQNVNKVSTAVRLTHVPTKIVITSQVQRYQGQNREYTLKILRAKLWAIEEEKRKNKMQDLKGEHKTPGWGNQIRSYVLHPYHMVKDLRTKYETADTERVLDGDLEDFILAYLKK